MRRVVMESDSHIPNFGPPLPLLDSSYFLLQPLYEELELLIPGVPAAFGNTPQVSHDFGYDLSNDTDVPLDSLLYVEELKSLEAELAQCLTSAGNENEGLDGPSEPNPTPRNLLQTPQTFSGLAEENNAEIATVPVEVIHDRRPFKCMHEGCERTFKNSQTLGAHRRTHPKHSRDRLARSASSKAGQNKKIPCRCPVCKKAFVGLYELRRHYGRKHSEGEKMHSCRKCGKKFYIDVDLREHEKLCGETLWCECGLKFAFKCSLLGHQRNHPECIKEHLNQLKQRSVRGD